MCIQRVEFWRAEYVRGDTERVRTASYHFDLDNISFFLFASEETSNMGIRHTNKREPENLDPVPILSQEGLNQDDTRPAVAHDAVFGDITEDGPNYRDVSASHRFLVVANTDTNRLDG
jgi:hypothetical protein